MKFARSLPICSSLTLPGTGAVAVEPQGLAGVWFDDDVQRPDTGFAAGLGRRQAILALEQMA
jgi:hypothetical protein